MLAGSTGKSGEPISGSRGCDNMPQGRLRPGRPQRNASGDQNGAGHRTSHAARDSGGNPPRVQHAATARTTPPNRPLVLSLPQHPCLYSDVNATSCCGKLPQRRVGPSLCILVMASLVSVLVPLYFLSPTVISFVQSGALRPPAVFGSGIRTMLPCHGCTTPSLPSHPFASAPVTFPPPIRLDPSAKDILLRAQGQSSEG